jgi:hypothetical protein
MDRKVVIQAFHSLDKKGGAVLDLERPMMLHRWDLDGPKPKTRAEMKAAAMVAPVPKVVEAPKVDWSMVAAPAPKMDNTSRLGDRIASMGVSGPPLRLR